MTEQREAVRVNSRISAEINDWLDKRSKETGVPKSSLIHIALEQYMMQVRSMNALELNQGTLKQLFEKVEQIENKLSNGNVMQS